MTRLLIVEDHADIAIGLKDHLVQEGFDARIAALGAAVPAILAEWPVDVLVLDLMLRRFPRPPQRSAGATRSPPAGTGNGRPSS